MTSSVKISLAAVGLIMVFAGLITWINLNMMELDRAASLEARRKPAVDLVKLDTDYRQQVRQIIVRYAAVEDNLAEHQLAQFRNELLALFVPGKFKQLHVDLIFAMNQQIEGLKTGDEGKKLAGQAVIRQAKDHYAWLN